MELMNYIIVLSAIFCSGDIYKSLVFNVINFLVMVPKFTSFTPWCSAFGSLVSILHIFWPCEFSPLGVSVHWMRSQS